MKIILLAVTVAFLLQSSLAFGQTSRATRQKREIESYIEKGSGDFDVLSTSITNNALNVSNPTSGGGEGLFFAGAVNGCGLGLQTKLTGSGNPNAIASYELTHSEGALIYSYSSGGDSILAFAAKAGSDGDDYVAGDVKAVLTSDGNMGIGTTSPDGKFTVYSGDSTVTPDSDGDEIFIENSSNAGLTIGTPASAVGALLFADPSAVKAGGIQYYHSNDSMRFNTNGANERMRIDSNGDVGIGKESDGDRLHTYESSGTSRILVESASLSNGQSSEFRAKGSGNGNIRYWFAGTYYNTGAATNAPTGFTAMQASDGQTSYLWYDNADTLRTSTNAAHLGTTSGTVVGDQTSDERTKQNIRSMKSGLEKVMKLDPIEYDQHGVHKLGFGAQRTRPVIPEAVYDTGMKIDDSGKTRLAMKYHQIVPVLTKAIQEQQAVIAMQRRWICSQADAPNDLCGGEK
jgi:hypothetical protein